MTDKIITLMGGVEYVATKLDGTTETVTIRQLPVKSMHKYLTLLDDEALLAELLCDKESESADLSEALLQLKAIGEQVKNAPKGNYSDAIQRVINKIETARAARWSDGLTNSAIEEIVAKGEDLNSDFFLRWMRRRKGRTAKINESLSTKTQSEEESTASRNSSAEPASA